MKPNGPDAIYRDGVTGMRRYATGLIITPWLPLRPERAVTGVFKRLRMLASALNQVCDRVRVLGIMPPRDVAALEDVGVLEQALKTCWGLPMDVAVTASHSRRETDWNHNIAGITDIGGQPDFHFSAAPEQVRAVRSELEQEPDLVLVHRLAAMIPVLRSGIRPHRLFFDLDDIEHRSRLRAVKLPPRTAGKLFRLSHLPIIVRTEQQGVSVACTTFVCSEEDRVYLSRIGFGGKIRVVPNAVDMLSPGFVRVPAPSLLFLGDLAHGPNLAGAERLIRRILPRLLKQCPNAHLIIAGARPEILPSFATAPRNVEFSGFVEDLSRLYARSRIVVCPLDAGGGTRIKLIEAAAHSKPMVSTFVGAENLGLEDGREILLREDDAAFAEACGRLLGDDDLCRRLGTAAYASVAGRYALDRVEKGLTGLFLGDA